MRKVLVLISVLIAALAAMSCTTPSSQEPRLATPTLDMKTWTWVRALYSDGKQLTPRRADAFTLSFGADGAFSASTDCNRIRGSYVVDGRKLTFGNDMAATRMFCADAQEAEFTALLSNTSSYMFTPNGELVLLLKVDSGSVIFR